jgi:uncharacterized protein
MGKCYMMHLFLLYPIVGTTIKYFMPSQKEIEELCEKVEHGDIYLEWVLKEFGRRHYENIAYFNFDENEEYRQFFETTKDVSRILQNLVFASGQTITPEKTLIIFDEVQDCPNVINSLKYFCENANEYHVVCAGSLLGIALAKPTSFPVGKVDFMDISPMTFSEFLLANGDENLLMYLDSVDSVSLIPDAFFNPLYEKIKMYFVTGGMPESVKMWTQERNTELMQTALLNIINAYERDFAKHPEPKEFPKISLLWKSIPSQLSRENKKFIYRVAKEGARAREYEDALQWLVDAQLVRKIYRSNAPGKSFTQVPKATGESRDTREEDRNNKDKILSGV